MRLGLLALSIAMLATAVFAAQSAFAVAVSTGSPTHDPQSDRIVSSASSAYGSLPFSPAAHDGAIVLAMR